MITSPLPIPPVFELISSLGQVSAAEMWEVFNMGCGFCAVVPASQADRAVDLLRARHPGTDVIGALDDRGRVTVTPLGIEGDERGLSES